MDKKFTRIIILLALGSIVCFASCFIVYTPHMDPKTIPDNASIVYSSSPQGFSLLDGNGEYLGYWKLKIPLLSVSPGESGIISSNFTWSFDGRRLVTRVSNVRPDVGYPVIIDMDGGIKYCPNKTFGGTGNAWLIRDNEVLTNPRINSVPVIILFNIEKCKLSSVLYEGKIGETLQNLSASVDGKIAFEQYGQDDIPGNNKLLVIDSKGIIIFSQYGGLSPTLSMDGSLLLFVDLNTGIMIYDFSDNSLKEITGEGVDYYSAISISKDNLKAIYNGMIDGEMKIVEVDLSSNQIEILTEGSNPNWR